MATTGGTNLRDDIMRLDETGKLELIHTYTSPQIWQSVYFNQNIEYCPSDNSFCTLLRCESETGSYMLQVNFYCFCLIVFLSVWESAV